MKVLVIDDDQDLTEVVSLCFEMRWPNSTILPAGTAEEGIRQAHATNPDVVILDIGLPDRDGFQVCREIRTFSDVPIIILTARSDDEDIVKGLEWGADDYITKPFRVRELVARVHALLRRIDGPEPSPEERLEHGPLVIDLTRHEVTLNGDALELTLAEFRLLVGLASQSGRVIPRARLVQQITAGGYQITERNVDVHVAAIRRKLGDTGKQIVTVRGIGYKFREGL